jgi:hypothetical protein
MMMRSCSVIPLSLCLLIASAAGTASAQVSYQSALGAGRLVYELPTDDQTIGLHTVGDFNHDGHRDLLLHSLVSEVAWVMLADGLGGYVSYGPYETGNTDMIVAGQLDDDAEPEVAFREFGFGYSIVYGPDTAPVEDQDFSISYFGGIGADAFEGVVKAADFDGDGKDELVFNTTDEFVFVRWSATQAVTPIELNGLGEENALYDPADYDGDGDLDVLLFSEDTQHFWIIEGTGGASLGSPREIMRAYPSIANDDRPAFGQLDANPALDMIVADSSLQQMHNEFNFVLATASSEQIDTDEFGLPLLITDDLDGDGSPDVVVMRPGQFPLPPNFRPEFEPGVLYNPTSNAPYIADLSVGQPRGDALYDQFSSFDAPLQQVWSFDVDLDGDSDLVWRWYDAAIENRPGLSGIPQLGMPSYDIDEGALYILPIDLDQDGFDEFIVTGSSMMQIFDMQDNTYESVTGSSNVFMLVEADLDGDGTTELVGSDTNFSRLKIWDVLADGSLGNRVLINSGQKVPYYGLEVADFNNDGRDDIAANRIDGTVDIYIGGSDPLLTPWSSVESSDPNGIKPAVFDFNHDGLPDLALSAGSNNSIELYANEGDGTFSAGPVLPRSVSDSWQYWIEAGDIDQDGNTDIAYIDRYFAGHVVVMFLNADGTLDEIAEVQTRDAVELVIEDFDGDGLPDLAIAGNVTGISEATPGVILQTAPRQFGEVISLPGFGSTSVAVSDLNMDGGSDLLSVSGSDRQLRAYYGSPSSCTADLNGDGELNFFDVSAFLVAFNAGDLSVDFNGDGMLNFFDVSAFLTEYNAGCP